jgi:hypothetical protein
MPTLFVLNGWKIQMFIDEREEPHFHIWKSGVQYRFRLRDFEQMPTDHSAAPADVVRMVVEWASRNRGALEAAYRVLITGGIPDKGLFTL